MPSVISIQNLSKTYATGFQALKNINLEIQRGEIFALLGPNGAGKTTLISTICGIVRPTSGTVTVDGHDIVTDYRAAREAIGLVPQDTLLFNTTIKENVLYGRLDATDEEVWDAIRAANAEKFIQGLPRGIDTKVGDRGLVLSGGQRQRIAIARAILKNPKILILDEATSALDTESEKIVQDALDKLMVGRTSFVIAHRLSTIKNADQILVLNHGVIEESGTHKELMEKKGLYYELYTMSQKNDREKNSDQ